MPVGMHIRRYRLIDTEKVAPERQQMPFVTRGGTGKRKLQTFDGEHTITGRSAARFLFIVEEMPCVVSVLCKVPESICCAPVNRLQRA